MKQVVNTASAATSNGASNSDEHFNRPGVLEMVRRATGLLAVPVLKHFGTVRSTLLLEVAL
jgi:hypothetical protein